MEPKTRWVIPTLTQVHQYHNLIKQLNNINQTWCQCHPQLLPSHQGRRKEEHTMYQWCTDSGGTACMQWLFIPGQWMKLNSNAVWLDLWYLTMVSWDVCELWIYMGVWKAIRYISLKMGSNCQEQRSDRWGGLCREEEYTEGVEGVWNEEGEHQINGGQHWWGLKSAGRGEMECTTTYRSTNSCGGQSQSWGGG